MKLLLRVPDAIGWTGKSCSELSCSLVGSVVLHGLNPNEELLDFLLMSGGDFWGIKSFFDLLRNGA